MLKRNLCHVVVGVAIAGAFGFIFRTNLARFGWDGLRAAGYSPFHIETRDMYFHSGNLELCGTLYVPTMKWIKYPAIVICHGGTKLGRRLTLYVMMARQLASRGYVVFTIDLRGFGDSEDPRRIETFADLDFVQDVSAALTVLTSLSQVDPSRLHTIGHSFGAGVAVMAGIRDVRVAKTVSIAPGRNTKERFFGAAASEPNWPSERMSQDMKIYPPISPALFDPHLKDYIAEAILDYPVHPPVLLVDGAEEYDEELVLLSDVYRQMTAPKGYVTIPQADHYFGTIRDQDGTAGDVAYDQTVLTALVDAIDQWLQP